MSDSCAHPRIRRSVVTLDGQPLLGERPVYVCADCGEMVTPQGMAEVMARSPNAEFAITSDKLADPPLDPIEIRRIREMLAEWKELGEWLEQLRDQLKARKG